MSYSDSPRLATQIARARAALADSQAFLALLTDGSPDQAAGAYLVLRRESVEGAAIRAFAEVACKANTELRIAALNRLQWTKHPDVLACLLECVNDADEQVRSLAASALGSFRSEAAVEALGAVLTTMPAGSLLRSVASSLAKCAGERAIPMLVAAFRAGAEPSPILETLGMLHAGQELAELYNETTGPVRGLVVEAVAETDHPVAFGLVQRLLREGDEGVRLASAKSLPRACLGVSVRAYARPDWLRDAVLALAAALDDAHEPVRKEAAGALGTLARQVEVLKEGDKSFAEALILAFSNAPARAQLPLLAFLSTNGAVRVTDELVACLRDADAGMRLRAAQAVAKSSDVRAGPALLPLVADSEPSIRALALRFIAALEGKEYDEAIDGAASDPAGEVRAAALGALAKRRGKAVVPLLLSALSDQDAVVRQAALTAIIPFGDLAAVPLILSQQWKSAWQVQSALDAVKDPAAISYFIAAIENDSPQRSFAMNWLMNRCTLDAKAQFVTLLEHRSEAVRKLARAALDKLPDPALVSEFARRMAEEKSSERWNAVHALWKIAKLMPQESMLAQLSHPAPRVRRIFARFAALLYAAEALPALGPLRTDADPAVRWWAAVAVEQAGRPAGPWDRPLDGHLGFEPPPDGVDL